MIHQNVPGGQIAVDDLQISMRERRHLALGLTPLDTRYSIPLATPYANLVRSLEVRASPTSPPSLEKLKNEDCFIRCSRKWVSNFPYITYSITQRYGSGMNPVKCCQSVDSSFTLFSADSQYGYYIRMRPNLLHNFHLLDQVINFLLSGVLLIIIDHK